MSHQIQLGPLPGPVEKELADQFGELKDKYAFRVEEEGSSTVVFAVVGRTEGGWGGLLGAGVWS